MELLRINERVLSLSLLLRGDIHRRSLPFFTSLQRVRSGALMAKHHMRREGRRVFT